MKWFIYTIQAAMILCKLLGWLNISWWAIFVPLYLYFGGILLFLAVVGLIYVLLTYNDKDD